MIEQADIERCQVEITSGNAFSLGNPRKTSRCDNKPIVLVKEVEPDKHGEYGEMTMCKSCYEVFKDVYKNDLNKYSFTNL